MNKIITYITMSAMSVLFWVLSVVTLAVAGFMKSDYTILGMCSIMMAGSWLCQTLLIHCFETEYGVRNFDFNDRARFWTAAVYIVLALMYLFTLYLVMS